MSRFLLITLIIQSLYTFSQEGIYTYVNLQLDKSELKMFTEQMISIDNDSAFYISSEIDEINNINQIEKGFSPLHLVDSLQHTRSYYITDYTGEVTYHNDSTGSSMSYPTEWLLADPTESDSVRALIQITGEGKNLDFKILGFHLIQNGNYNGKIDTARSDLYYHLNSDVVPKIKLTKRIQCSFILPEKSDAEQGLYQGKIIHFALFYEGMYSFNHFDNFNYQELIYIQKHKIPLYNQDLDYVFDFSLGKNQFKIE
jgi:hypothetical protein